MHITPVFRKLQSAKWSFYLSILKPGFISSGCSDQESWRIEIEVKEREIDRSELCQADEVFFSGTGAKVSPMVKIDDRLLRRGGCSLVARKIQDIYISQ